MTQTEGRDAAVDETAQAQDVAKAAAPGGDGIAGLRRVTIWALGLAVLLFVYFVVADRTTPFAGDATVQAFVLRVTPEVGGRVVSVNVRDNELVEEGGVLFAIDPEPFKLAVAQAQARLDQAGQSVGADTASVEAAAARVAQARAVEQNVRAQSARVLELVAKGIYAKAREDDAVAAIDQATAAVATAEADLQRTREQLGPAGATNPAVLEALAALETARFQLSHTKLSAPGRGVVTNLQLAVGQTVAPGHSAMTFISAQEVWLLASMRENSLGVLEPGQRAEVVLDAIPGRVFSATVRSIGWGVAGQSVDPATGLPKTSAAQGWLTNPQRFPVVLSFDQESLPFGARYGSRAATIVYAGRNPIMDAVAWARIRLIALLTYVS